jgi:SAM-dependent methyltransferase
MASEARSTRATSFGAIAEEYDRFRPGPPVEAVAWVLGSARRVAVEIGAGTGACTRLLVGAVDRVVAAEPDRRMGAVLATRVPAAEVVAARAEELPLVGRCVDAVVGSSMWHWVDGERAGWEAARVLRPGGVLGVLWSGPDRTQAWLAEILSGSGLIRRSGDATYRQHRHELELPVGAPFSAAERQTVEWSLAVSAEELVGLACTYSGFIVLPEAEKVRLRQVVADVVADVVSRHVAATDGAEILMPMRCICWRAVRRP